MPLAQFRLRSLLVLVLVAGLILAVGVLTLQNQRLREENAKLQASQRTFALSGFLPSQVLNWSSASVIVDDQTVIEQLGRNSAGAGVNDIPNGPSAFTKGESAR
jgi:hypothetical protein